MTQLKQTQKVKLFHILKVVFYLLGLPLFFIAVFFTAIKFIGVEPFVGLSTSSFASGVFVGYERFITSPALYGIWCAFAIWAFISICHIVLARFVKSSKVRMFAIIALILVVMLGTMGIMDAAFEAQIGKIADGAPEGVSVLNYQDQLSYYDYVSYGRKEKSLAYQLSKSVSKYEDVYNIKWQGIDKSGEAGNISNKPVTYANIIADDGTIGATPDTGKHSDNLVENKPNKAGQLVIGGKTYSNYFYITRTASDGTECYVWYSLDLVPVGYKWNAKKGKMTFNQTDGIYGKGLYNQNGMLSDGWVFSFENMLNILEDYYESQEHLTSLEKTTDGLQGIMASIREEAGKLRDQYYDGAELPTLGKADARTQALYDQELTFADNFSITQGRLEEIVSYLGAMLGDNNLFDWLLNDSKVETLVSEIGNRMGMDALATLIPDLKGAGVSLNGLLKAFKQEKIVGTILDIFRGMYPEQTIDDIYIRLTYRDNADPATGKHVYLELRSNTGKGEEGLLADVDFTDGLLEAEPDENGNYTYNFDLDRLSTFLNNLLNAAVGKLLPDGLFDTLSGLIFTETTFKGQPYYALDIAGFSIPLLRLTKDNEGKVTSQTFDIDLVETLTDVLQGFYNYQSPKIKPVWDFYTEAVISKKDDLGDNYDTYLHVAENIESYDRAYYEAVVYGGMIGSTLVGDTLGAGTYPAALGLTDLASVQQLKTDLSYQPKNFPLYSFRNMLLTFAGIVMLFYFLSFVAAEKERKYAGIIACEGKSCDANAEAEGALVEETEEARPAKKNKLTETVDKVCKLATTKSKQATLGRKITTYVLYALAFLPLLIIGIVVAAKSSAILPSYGGMHFIGFVILLVLAIVYAVVVILLTRKASKSSATSKTVRIGITYVCLTAVLALILTYVLPDAVAKATSSTLWVEDMYNDPLAQVEENASLERDFIMYNLLNGNLNKYETTEKGVQLAENGDFSYLGLEKKSGSKYAIKDIQDRYDYYVKTYASKDKFDALIAGLDAQRAQLFDFVYQYYVLNDTDYAFAYKASEVRSRRAIAMSIVDYLYDHADYAGLVKQGFKNPKIKQLFDDNYDSFNQDGYKTFDDPLLLYAQLDGRMTVPVVVRLILNKGWTYTQPSYDAEGNVFFDEDNTFLYENYDPATVKEFKDNGGKFDREGELRNGDGGTIKVKYGVNKEGWKLYENGIVRRPLNWLVLDMLGDPMDLAAIGLGNDLAGIPMETLMEVLSGKGIYETVGGLLNEDVPALVDRLTDGAGLRLGLFINDSKELCIQLLPMNSTYGMLGYMQATWVQSNGLLMAVINVMALRNYLYIFAGIGLFLIMLAGVLIDIEKKYGYEAAPAAEGTTPDATELEPIEPTAENEPEAEGAETEKEPETAPEE